MEELKRAERALAQNQPSAALEALVAAWGSCKSPRLAATADALCQKLTGALPPIGDSLEGRDFHDAWMLVARQERLEDVGRLLPGLRRPPLGKSLVERCAHILARPDDPRIALLLAQLVETPPATAQSLFPTLWAPLGKRLIELGDVRARELLQARVDAPKGTSRFWPKIAKLAQRWLDALPTTTPELPRGAAGQLDRIEKRVRELSPAAPALETTQDDAAYLAAVFDNPRTTRCASSTATGFKTRVTPGASSSPFKPRSDSEPATGPRLVSSDC